MPPPDPEQLRFPSLARARAADRRKLLVAGLVLAVVFVAVVPFAKVQLPEVWAFLPAYQGALAIGDLVTAVLLYAQFNRLRSQSLLLLAGGYLFAALMAVIHALTFPRLFAPEGLLGGGPQTTAWLYMFWHGGFPAMVVLYSLLKDRNGVERPDHTALAINILAVLVAVAALTLVATVGAPRLPPIMAGNAYTPLMVGVVTAVWAFSLAAFLVLWLRMPHSVLDIWLMLVMASWMFEVALSAVLNAGRFDVGFYAGRLFGLAAGTYVLIMLLLRRDRSP
jgi:hypothetical protein